MPISAALLPMSRPGDRGGRGTPHRKGIQRRPARRVPASRTGTSGRDWSSAPAPPTTTCAWFSWSSESTQGLIRSPPLADLHW